MGVTRLIFFQESKIYPYLHYFEDNFYIKRYECTFLKNLALIISKFCFYFIDFYMTF